MLRPAVAKVAVALTCVLTLTACSSSSGTSSSTTATTFVLPLAHQPVASPLTATSMLINGTSVAIPREEYRPDRPIQQETDKGQQIMITDKGILPVQLFAPIPATITWTNLTSKPVSLLVSKFGTPVRSPEIPAGSSYSMAFPVSGGGGGVTYVTSTRLTGTIGLDVLPMAPIPQG